MTDQDTAVGRRTGEIDLTDDAITSARQPAGVSTGSEPVADDTTSGEEQGGGRSRGQVATMIAGALVLVTGMLLGMRWARQRRSDTTVVIVDEPEASRWRRLVRRDGVATAA